MTPQTQQQTTPQFILVVSLEEANTIIQALDELPGKLSRPISQKLIAQSNQQPDLMAQIATQHQQQAAQQEQIAAAPDAEAEETPVARAFKNKKQ